MTTRRQTLAMFAQLFSYPDAAYGEHVRRVRIEHRSASSQPTCHPERSEGPGRAGRRNATIESAGIVMEGRSGSEPYAAHLGRFAEEIARLDISDLQALYTSTFDLAPSCSPYLGIHLFGEEGRERARLMVGLRLAYKRIGEERHGELPDHVAEVLRFASLFADDEWAELRTLVLTPALATMHELLNDSGNPYRHLIAAALALLEQHEPLEMHEPSRIDVFEPAIQGGRP